MKIKIILFICSLALMMPFFTFAEEGGTNQYNILEKTVNPGDQLEGVVKVSNNGAEEKKIGLKAIGFEVIQDTEGIDLEFMNDEEVEWVEFLEKDFSISPDEVKEVVYQINIPADFQSGAHYLALMVNSDNQKVIDSVFLLNVGGTAETKGRIKEFYTDKDYYNPGELVNFNVLYKNSGDTIIKPQGIIEIFKGSQKVDELVINPEANLVFPGTEYNFKVEWQEGANFGKYQARLSGSFLGLEEGQEYAVNFWIINWLILAVVLGVIGFSIILIIFFTKKKAKKIQE
ncbi:MAG: hypothetical protein ABH835_05105 [Patescibacteria group bacterium]